jgi:hypothetical protein
MCSAQPTSQIPIKELMTQLGSNSFKVREQATGELKQRDDAILIVREATRSPDPEVATRAKDILKALNARSQQRVSNRCRSRIEKKLPEYLENGQIDLATEVFSHAADRKTVDFGWPLMCEFVEKKILAAQLVSEVTSQWGEPKLATRYEAFTKQPNIPFYFGTRQIDDSPETRKEQIASSRASIVNNANPSKETIARFNRSLVAASGARVSSGFWNSLIFANHLCESNHIVSRSVIVADGDVHLPMGSECIVIARGAVKFLTGRLHGSVILCGEKTVPEFEKDAKGNIIRVNQVKPLGIITFFNPSDLGIEVEIEKNIVSVSSLKEDSPLLKSGLKVGDIIEAIDGGVVDSADSFRRWLRRGYVSQESIFSILRKNKEIELSVAYPDKHAK